MWNELSKYDEISPQTLTVHRLHFSFISLPRKGIANYLMHISLSLVAKLATPTGWFSA